MQNGQYQKCFERGIHLLRSYVPSFEDEKEFPQQACRWSVRIELYTQGDGDVDIDSTPVSHFIGVQPASLRPLTDASNHCQKCLVSFRRASYQLWNKIRHACGVHGSTRWSINTINARIVVNIKVLGNASRVEPSKKQIDVHALPIKGQNRNGSALYGDKVGHVGMPPNPFR